MSTVQEGRTCHALTLQTPSRPTKGLKSFVSPAYNQEEKYQLPSSRRKGPWDTTLAFRRTYHIKPAKETKARTSRNLASSC